MKLKRTFVLSKMNKDLDERLLPSGQYPHAENIRVANTDASSVGSVENVKGNFQITSFSLTNAKTLGGIKDSSNQKIYWFTTSDTKDMVVEYDILNLKVNILLETTRTEKDSGILNFNENFLITGVVKIINGDSDKDLLIWTDDFNPPRMINIERSKTYGIDGFEEDDISLIKKPPRFAPKINYTFTSSSKENNLENKFISFTYRYKYLDGEYSSLSSFSNYCFSPKAFNLDYQTMENNGMVNIFNAMKIIFNTGDKRVTDVEIIYKESNSNTLFLIDTFNKKQENWEDNEEYSFTFSNSKKYVALSDFELYRRYDNIPLLAKALTVINNRLVFGNYVEGYNLKDKSKQDIYIDYNVSIINKELVGNTIPITLVNNSNLINIDFTNIELKKDSRLSFEFSLKESEPNTDGLYSNGLDFILNKDYKNVLVLADDKDFILFIQDLLTENFKTYYKTTIPPDSTVKEILKFDISILTDATNLYISSPSVVYEIPNPEDPENPKIITRKWIFTKSTNVYYKETSVNSSLKSNRSYEVGVIYLDKYNRSTTVLTNTNNSIYIPQNFNNYQNKILVSIHNNPPYWADRFKLVVKQNKDFYQTIYCNVFLEDGLYRWILLEGANKDKVKEGDTLIVKSDIGGVVEDLIKIRVLELTTKEAKFIKEAPSGLYMKIKPVGIDLNAANITISTFNGYTSYRYPIRTFTYPPFGQGDPFELYKLNAGSSIRIYIEFKASGNISYFTTYDKTYRVQNDYDSVKEWFDAEVKNLGDFGKWFTWNGRSDIGNNICCGHGEADEWNHTSGWGFSEDGRQFYVVPHRKGTAERNIRSAVVFTIEFGGNTIIFETEPKDSTNDIFYETADTFEIIDDKHNGNISNQTNNSPAIIEMDFFNCYVQGNGAETYRYKDIFNSNFLNIDSRPTTTSIEKYKEVRRYADLTYSEPYNENNNLNGLNEFNLSRGNFKDDIDKKYGYIQKLYSRDTDLIVFQEDKVSKVLYGKNLLMNADGSSNVSIIEDILGTQISFRGEYGISRNPESFSFDGFNIYFTDAKRGTVMRLFNDTLEEISLLGLKQFFKDKFKNNIDNKKTGGYDPYYNEYIIHSSSDPVNTPLDIKCSDFFIKSDFFGELIVNIDYGLSIGFGAGIVWDTNGVPLLFTIYLGDDTFDTGFVGDPKYNKELEELGYPPVSRDSQGTFQFEKNKIFPTIAKLKIFAPICGSDFKLTTLCHKEDDKKIYFIISNQPEYENKSSINRFKWVRDNYNSSYKSDQTIYKKEFISHFEILSGRQGDGFIPLLGSDVIMEAYSNFSVDSPFKSGGRFGYLLTDKAYKPEDIKDIVDDFTFIEDPEEIVYPNGDLLYTGKFTLPESMSNLDIYLLYDYQATPAITINTKIIIYFDDSGSMNGTLEPLEKMRDTILKERLLPLYDYDSDLYDKSVIIISQSDERTIDMLNMNGRTPDGNVIVLVFQDEAVPVYHGRSVDTLCPYTQKYNDDISIFIDRLKSFNPLYYRAIIFQVATGGSIYEVFKEFLKHVQNGTDCYSGDKGLKDREEIIFKYDITPSGTPEYYLDNIVEGLKDLGYDL